MGLSPENTSAKIAGSEIGTQQILARKTCIECQLNIIVKGNILRAP